MRSVDQINESINVSSITVNTGVQEMSNLQEIVIKSVDELVKLIGSSFFMNGQKYSLKL